MKRSRLLLTGVIIAGAMAFTGCSDDEPLGATTGTLEVLLLFDGTDIDSDGGLLFLDGSAVGSLTEDIEMSVDELAEGVYVLEVRGITENCGSIGSNPRNVRIRAGEVATEQFRFLCEAVSEKDPGDDGRPEV